MNNLIAIIGPTAGGKTAVAAQLAFKINGEIISADSRQVYKGMNLGTGKDYGDYLVQGKQIPVHLIDIAEAGYKYNVFEYQSDFLKAYQLISSKNKPVILCGGTGMYIEAVTKGYKLINVPINTELRLELEKLSDSELSELLQSKKALHNTTDTTNRKRTIRAIEIAVYEGQNSEIDFSYPEFNTIYFGIRFDRNSQRRRITERLNQRLKEGMIEEVELLLANGVDPEVLVYYGLEYKFLTQFVKNELTYKDMFQQLNTAIHQFAKRQMTWYRRMEKNGIKINWLDGYMPMEEKLDRIEKIINNSEKRD